MEIEYILTASGRIGLIQLEINVPGKTDTNAVELAKLMVKALHGAGYYSFTLFKNRGDGHVKVKSFIVEQADPIVSEV